MTDFEGGDWLRVVHEQKISRRRFLRRSAEAGIGLAILSTPAAAFAVRNRVFATPPVKGTDISFDELVAEAKKEELNVIALPHDWANYGEILFTFKDKYGLKINEANPDGSSAQENQAIRSLKGDSRAPDVVDVGPSFAIDGATEGLYATYFNTNFATVPRAMKDGRGFWTGDYWGVISFGVNQNVVKNVPKSWADLTKPEYKNAVALNGSPLSAGSAVAGVFAASVGNGGSLNDIGPGIQFFSKLKKAGNFIPVDATTQTIVSGQTPIVLNWDYLNLGNARDNPSAKIATVIPKDGVYGAYFAQAVSATAPHPFAARLWEEFLFSDTGQLLWLKGFSHPARFQDLVARRKVPKFMLRALPPPAIYAGVKFANRVQLTNAKAKIASDWAAAVA